MTDDQPTLDEQIKARDAENKRQRDKMHEDRAKHFGLHMLKELAAIDTRKLTALHTGPNGRHYRLRIDVVSDWKAKRLSRKIHRKGEGIK